MNSNSSLSVGVRFELVEALRVAFVGPNKSHAFAQRLFRDKTNGGV